MILLYKAISLNQFFDSFLFLALKEHQKYMILALKIYFIDVFLYFIFYRILWKNIFVNIHKMVF